VVRRAFVPQSRSDGSFDDVVSDFGVREQELEADAGKAPGAVEVGEVREQKVDDIGDVSMPEKVEVGDVREMKADDIGDLSAPKAVEIADEPRKSDFVEDVQVQRERRSPEIHLKETTKRDYDPDFEFDNMSDFVIEDIQDMKDDEFDFAPLSDGDVDMDELAGEDAPEGELDIDPAVKPYEVSSKYDWSW